MYTLLRHYIRKFQEKPERNICILGLDNAGKTSFLNEVKRMYNKRLIELIVPTIGQNYESVVVKSYKLNFWDIGGQAGLRKRIWDKYFARANAIIFLVDSGDPQRFDEVIMEINRLHVSPELLNVPFCICVNKRDLPDVLDVPEIVLKLNLENTLMIRKFGVFETISIPEGAKGHKDILDWLIEVFKTE